jgi:small-conductance mechanosensitive channel
MAPPDTTPTPEQVEALQERLRGLLREREQLRAGGAQRAALEENRRTIVDTQWALSRALIARYHPSYQAA